MRTTLDIDTNLVEEVVRATGQKTKSRAVNEALAEYVRAKAYEKLLAAAGTMQIDDNWDIWRRMDLGKLREFEADDTHWK